MTEAEWLASDRPEYLYHVQSKHLSDRRRRLVGIALCREIPPVLVEPSILEQSLAIAERFAEQPHADLPADDLLEWGVLQTLPIWNDPPSSPGERCKHDARQALGQLARDITHMAIFHVACARDPSTHARAVAVDPFLTNVVRDILGNPFRPVSLASEWHTSTVVALASQMYESRDFSAMPILADALQDAGCDSADVLDHCRGPGPHVRGCWVVDLVLGKA